MMKKPFFFTKPCSIRDATVSAAHYELARIYGNLEENESAMHYAKLAVKHSPENEWYQMLLADMHQKIGDDEAAAKVFAQTHQAISE